MNKEDILLCVLTLIAALLIYFILNSKTTKPKEAFVYYENKEILKIDLSNSELRYYTVNGYNGDVIIETSNGKVRVVEEKSPKHICSKQGYIESNMQSIICLPNKILIVIQDKNDDIDVVVG